MHCTPELSLQIPERRGSPPIREITSREDSPQIPRIPDMSRTHAKSMNDLRQAAATTDIAQHCRLAKRSADAQVYILMQVLTQRDSSRDSRRL